jgi:hypothetical protein
MSSDDYQDHAGNKYDDSVRWSTGASGYELRQAGVDANWDSYTQHMALINHRDAMGLDPWGNPKHETPSPDYSSSSSASSSSAYYPTSTARRTKDASALAPPDRNRSPAALLGSAAKTLDHPLVRELEEATGCLWFHFGSGLLAGTGDEGGTIYPLLKLEGYSRPLPITAWKGMDWYEGVRSRLSLADDEPVVVYGCFELGQVRMQHQPICLVLGILKIRTMTWSAYALNEKTWRSQSALSDEERWAAGFAYARAAADQKDFQAIRNWLDDPVIASARKKTRKTFAADFAARRPTRSEHEDLSVPHSTARAARSVTQVYGRRVAVVADKCVADLEAATGALWFRYGPVRLSEVVNRTVRVGDAPQRSAYTRDFGGGPAPVEFPAAGKTLAEALVEVDATAGDRILVCGASAFAEIAEEDTPIPVLLGVANLTKDKFFFRHTRGLGRLEKTGIARLSNEEIYGLVLAYRKAAADRKNIPILRDWLQAPERARILAEMRKAMEPQVAARRHSPWVKWLPPTILASIAAYAVAAYALA